jgi:hypothetical protein
MISKQAHEKTHKSVNEEMHINTAMSYHTVRLKGLEILSSDEDVEQHERSHLAAEMTNDSHF